MEIKFFSSGFFKTSFSAQSLFMKMASTFITGYIFIKKISLIYESKKKISSVYYEKKRIKYLRQARKKYREDVEYRERIKKYYREKYQNDAMEEKNLFQRGGVFDDDGTPKSRKQ